jgi:hypothetical protein
MSARKWQSWCPDTGSVHGPTWPLGESSSAIPLERLPTVFQGEDEIFPRFLLTLLMELNLSRLPVDAIHVRGFGGDDGGVA